MTPQLAEALREYCSSSIRVAIPCTVEAFDAVNQIVDLQPCIKDVNQRGEYTSPPVLVCVPVQFPGGSQYGVTFPLAVGDEGLCVFSDSDISTWAIEGGTVNPNTPRQHHMADGVFIPGIRSSAHKLSEFKTDAIVVGKQGSVGVRVKTGSVELGVAHADTPTKSVATADDVIAVLNALKNAFDKWVPVLNDGGTALKAVLTELFTEDPVTGRLAWPGVASGISAQNIKVK